MFYKRVWWGHSAMAEASFWVIRWQGGAWSIVPVPIYPSLSDPPAFSNNVLQVNAIRKKESSQTHTHNLSEIPRYYCVFLFEYFWYNTNNMLSPRFPTHMKGHGNISPPRLDMTIYIYWWDDLSILKMIFAILEIKWVFHRLFSRSYFENVRMDKHIQNTRNIVVLMLINTQAVFSQQIFIIHLDAMPTSKFSIPRMFLFRLAIHIPSKEVFLGG